MPAMGAGYLGSTPTCQLEYIARSKPGIAMTQYDAVVQAIVDYQLGIQTSLAVLAQKASVIYGSTVSTSAACIARKRYCKEYDVDVLDNRTYNGQPRRNMYADLVTLDGVRLVHFILNGRPKTAEQFLAALEKSKLHSLDQVKACVRELTTFRSNAA